MWVTLPTTRESWGNYYMLRRTEGHRIGATRSLRWVLRGMLSLVGALLLGGAFTAAASADDSLVGDLLGGADDVVEDTTGIVESVTYNVTGSAESSETEEAEPETVAAETESESESESESADAGSEAEAAQETEPEAHDGSESVVTKVVEPVVETTEAVTEP